MGEESASLLQEDPVTPASHSDCLVLLESLFSLPHLFSAVLKPLSLNLAGNTSFLLLPTIGHFVVLYYVNCDVM